MVVVVEEGGLLAEPSFLEADGNGARSLICEDAWREDTCTAHAVPMKVRSLMYANATR